MPSTPLVLSPDRALPVDPGQRSVAREIYLATAKLPIVSMHGHVAAETFEANAQFTDPTSLLITPDHYVCRMLYSQGYQPSDLGLGEGEADSRKIWNLFCSNWHLYRGTASRYWLETEFADVFGVAEQPSSDNADALYDQVNAVIHQDDFRPLQLLDRFNIELISTTDPASARLESHARLAQAGWGQRIVPTFRPDTAIDLLGTGWRTEIQQLGEATGIDSSTYLGYLEALRASRQHFKAAGARATDHGPFSAEIKRLDSSEAEAIFNQAVQGKNVSEKANQAFCGHMLYLMAEMSCEDGLVMQLHPGVIRNQHSAMAARYGADIGFDIPVGVEFARSLQPMLDAFGMDPRFRCILFTIDETLYI